MRNGVGYFRPSIEEFSAQMTPPPLENVMESCERRDCSFVGGKREFATMNEWNEEESMVLLEKIGKSNQFLRYWFVCDIDSVDGKSVR